MFTLILQSAIASAIFIFLIHYLVKFFKNTLTTPKIKDFVTLPAQKYKKMFDTMNGTQTRDLNVDNISKNESVSSEDMKNELKNFMKTHLTPSNQATSTPIDEISEFSFSSSGDFTPLSSTFITF